MMRICVAMCACALLLGGCMASTKTPVTHHFTLGGSAVAAPATHHASRAGCGTLAIARIDVPAWLAGTSMYYRLDYQHGNQLAAYGYSDWVAPPATLLEPIIQRAIVADSCWHAVVGPGNPATADATLYLRLNDFSQTFASPDQSAGVIDGTATLIDDHSHGVIVQLPFHLKVAAASADAQGGATALNTASHQLAAHLASTLQQAAGHPR